MYTLHNRNSEKALIIASTDAYHEVKAIVCIELRQNNATFLCDLNIADFSGGILNLSAEKNFCEILQFIEETLRPSCMKFVPVCGTDHVARVLESYVRDHAGHRARRTIYCQSHQVSTSCSYPELKSTFSKKLRQELRTSSNKLSKLGKLDFRIPEDRDSKLLLFEQLCEFHLARQSDKVGFSVFSNTEYRDFFEYLLLSSTNSFKTQVSGIYINNKPVSACLSLSCNGHFFYWIPSFDVSVKSASLGKTHISYLLEYCCSNDFSVFDFMGGSEPYKMQWPVQSESIYRFDIYRSSYTYRLNRMISTGSGYPRRILKKCPRILKLLKKAIITYQKLFSRK